LVTITQKKYILEMLKCFQHGKLSWTINQHQ
jgi:hypothetical protein